MIWFHRIRYWIRGLTLRLRFLFKKSATEGELDEELRFHLEMEIRQNLSAGLSPAEARRQAFLSFGGTERFKEQVRDARGVRPLEELIQDSRHTFRQLRKTPFFTIAAILTLAIGIGANTSVFSIVNGGLIRNRPYRDQDALVNIYTAVERQSLYATSFAQDLPDLRNLDDVFLAVGAYRGTASRIQEEGGSRMVLAEAVTSDLFPLVGLDMALGRGFTQEEELVPGTHPVTVLGYGFWQEKYGGDPEVIGRTIRLAGIPFTIIGVAPEAFESFTAQSFRTTLFVPVSMAEAISGENHHDLIPERGVDGYKIIARLRPGVGFGQAKARVEGLSLGLKETFSKAYEDRSFHLHPTQDVALQPDVDAFFMKAAVLLMAAVVLVLLLASTNLASFLLARGMDRRRELALKLALGATRGRLVRQLLTESFILGALGAVAGLLLGRWCLDLLVAVGPPTTLPLDIDTRLDSTVFLFTVGITVGAGLLAGLAPALQGTRIDLAPALKDGGKNETRSRTSLRSGLVAIQVAISMVLLVSGGLFIRSLQAAEEMDPGFSTREAGMVWVDMNVGGVPREEWEVVAGELAERAGALPSIQEVGASNGLPLSESVYRAQYSIPGAEPPPGEDFHTAFYLAIDHGFLQVMGIPMVAGRGITTLDRTGTEGVVLVSEAAAHRFWPGEDPLGREVRPEGLDASFTVVGVVQDTKVVSFREGPTPLFYFSRLQHSRRSGQLWLVARGTAASSEIAGALRGLVAEVNPDLVIVQAQTMEDHLALALFLPRVGATLMGFFGLMALTLASLGLYGSVSYAASRRTRELGVRMSLGASRGSVVRMVVRDGLGPVLAGSLLGLAGALVLVRFLGSYLIGISPHDPLTILGVPCLLMGVSLLAAWIPARRAGQVSPVQALRSD